MSILSPPSMVLQFNMDPEMTLRHEYAQGGLYMLIPYPMKQFLMRPELHD
jgi:hypothetical protein